MRYNVLGFNQQLLINNYKNLNSSDIITLRIFVDLMRRLPRKKVIDGKVYVQITYDILLQDLPVITESKSTIKRIIQKFIDEDLIEREVYNKGGKYTYFRETEKIKELESIPTFENSKDINLDTGKPYTLREKREMLENILVDNYCSDELIKLIKLAKSYDVFKVIDNLHGSKYKSKYIENYLKQLLCLE